MLGVRSCLGLCEPTPPVHSYGKGDRMAYHFPGLNWCLPLFCVVWLPNQVVDDMHLRNVWCKHGHPRIVSAQMYQDPVCVCVCI